MNRKITIVKNILGVAIGFTTVFATSGVIAEEGGSRYALEEVEVTARRVEEGLQNAPIAVTALTGLDLENRGALDIVDFADVAPNVSLKTDGTTSGFAAAPRTSIRGVGQSDFVINTDPAVGIYADGVYLGRSIGSVLDLVDVERVEALRGPQGTLFGRNSTGGAINIISKKPEIDGGVFGYGDINFGEDGYSVIRGSINVPLGDTAAARFTAMHRERDGHIPSLTFDNFALGAEDVTGLRGALRWQPRDTLTVDFDVDYSERSDSAAPFIPVFIGDLSSVESNVQLTTGAGPQSSGISTSVFARRFNGEAFTPPVPPSILPFTSTDPLCSSSQEYRDANLTCLGNAWASTVNGSNQAWFDRNGNLVRPDDQALETYGFSARLSWELGPYTLNTISAWRGFDSSFLNGSPTPIYIATNDNEVFDQDQFSQEITLTGDIGDRVSFIGGLYYQEEDGIETVRTIFTLSPAAGNNDLDFLPTNGVEGRNIDNTSQAIFGQLSYAVTDSIDLTVGARYTEEEKDVRIDQITDSEGVISGVLEGTQEVEEPSYLVNLSWQATDDLLFYGSFSDGFRNGGFPARTPAGSVLFQEVSYDPEFVDSFELGMKGTFCDGALRANLAVFYSEFTDQQLGATAFDPGVGANLNTIANLADSEITGLELEANWLVTDNFRIDLSLGTLDTELTDILTEDNQFILNTDTNVQRIVTEGDNTVLPFSPEIQANIGANYSFFTGTGAEIRNRLDVFYEDEQFSNLSNQDLTRIPSTTRVNYRLTYVPADAPWEVTLGARNLTDERDILNANINTAPGGGSAFQVISRGREAYVGFKYNFGG